MKKDQNLLLANDDATNRKILAEIKEKILSELDIDKTLTHTTESPLFETLASLTTTKLPSQA